ncbi:MAG: beta strand repeat-containing protein, partial [Roseimicrobium sp.]
MATPGAPGVYSWQHLYNWAPTPFAVPSAAGDSASIQLDLLGNQTVNLDGAVALGSLNLGDTTGASVLTLAAGTGGSLTFDNALAGAQLSHTGVGTSVLSSNITLADALSIQVDSGILASTGVISGNGFNITKSGDGLLLLRGTNTFNGVFNINGGNVLLAPIANDGAVLGVTAGATIVGNGASLSYGPDANGSGPIGNPAEPITINGEGYRNAGALRSFIGANGSTVNGPIALGSAARIHNEGSGTFTLSGNITVNQTLKLGGLGFVDLAGEVTGASEINHYGISGMRLRGVSANQSYSGTINSTLGEIRADYGTDVVANAPYADVTALNLKNSWLRLGFGTGAGSATADDNTNNTANTRFSTTAPITMAASQIFLDNPGFAAGTANANLFDYNAIQGFGITTMTAGLNRIGMRSADTGGVEMTFANLVRTAGSGVTLELTISDLVGGYIGVDTKHQIINTALEGGANVPFLGGWAYANSEFVKYNAVSNAGFGYTPLVAADYATDSAEGTWSSGQNIKLSAGGATMTANRIIQSLNMQNATARTLAGNAGTTLEIGSGGILTSGGTHVITVPTITAGAASGYELYDIAWAANRIDSVIADNASNAVSLVKTGGSLTSLFGANTYTGTTYLSEGGLREPVGSNRVSLGSGNLNMNGGPNTQAYYETPRSFTRALGTGVGQVQLTGGGGLGGGSVGFSAFGAPIDVNFGGAGASITWGSPTFNPGIFTLNGGNATQVVTLVNPIDLGGEQRYVRLDGGGSGSGRGAIGIMEGNLSNGGIIKRGGGILMFENANTYQGGTTVNEGELWLRGAGTAGADVPGNDILVGSFARLIVDSPSNIGSKQMLVLQNGDGNSAAGITFGPGYGTGEGIVFNSLAATGGTPGTGPYNVLIANNQSAQARRVSVSISGLHNFTADLPGQIRNVAPNVEAWFGADNGNGTFTGTTLSPTGGAATAFRLGGFNGTGALLTIANANVLSGAFPLIVGAPDQNDRQYTDGIVYIPKAQNYSGQVTIGNGGILHVGSNAALSTGNNTVNLRTGELRNETIVGGYGTTDTQYGSRILDIQGGNATFRTSAIGGGGYNTVTLGSINFPETGADRALVVQTLGTIFTNLQVPTIVMPNEARITHLDIGTDNSFQAGAGILTVTGVIADQTTGAQSLRKRNGGVLVLNADNTYDGNTLVQQGRLVLTHVGAAGSPASSLQFETNNDRTSQIEFRLDGSGTIANATMTTGTGGNDGSTRIITVGPVTPGNENATVVIPALTIGHAGTYAVGGGTNSAVFFDGFNGYKIEIPSLVLARDISLRPRGAVTTITGVVSGAAGFDLEKNDQGTLILNGDNTFNGTTTLSNGTIIAGHNNAFGVSTSDINFRNNVFTQVLAAGNRTISRNFINTATGSTQTIGGLDAGAKLFSGNINLSSRGMSLTAAVGGDVTFSGVMSETTAGQGITKLGSGTVVLNPSSGTGNTYTGGTTITGGTLVGQAQATSGNPFGTGAFTIVSGALKIQGLAAPTANSLTTTTGALNLNDFGGGQIVVNDVAADGFTTQMNFGSLNRTNNNVLTFIGQRTGMGAAAGEERISFTTAPSVANGTIGTFAVLTGGASKAGHFASLDGSNSIVTATYASAPADLKGSTLSTNLWDATGFGGALTGNRAAYGVRTDAAISLGGNTLSLGTGGEAGLILNNGADVTGAGSINFGANYLSVYVDDAAVSTFGSTVTAFRDNQNNTLATRFSKFGPGTLEVATPMTFEGHLRVVEGTLSLTAPNVLPTFENLNAISGSIVAIRPGATVLLNNHNQEFGNLSAINPGSEALFTGGILNLGSADIVVGREGSTQTFSGQLIGTSGSSLTKIGGGTLTLTNYNAAQPNSLGTLIVDQGTVASRNNDQSWAQPGAGFASAIPATTDVYLRGGTWQVRSIGDSTGNQQRIQIGNNIIAGGGDSVLSTVRDQGGGSNKLLVFGNLTLGVQRFLTNNDNTFIPRFDGATTLTNFARIQTDNQLVLAGAITGNYSLEKRGGSDLALGANNSAWNGGMVLTDGTLLFGNRGTDDIRYQGTTFVPSITANAGTGDLVV